MAKKKYEVPCKCHKCGGNYISLEATPLPRWMKVWPKDCPDCRRSGKDNSESGYGYSKMRKPRAAAG